ncbi:hypothetical protein IP70_11795 [alpha proteobacterium AAP38]|nr:hypothetical protein IP70_11795 [alpha proteobacterium AAP38]
MRLPLLAATLTLCLLSPTAFARPVAECQSAEEAEMAAALAAEGIAEPTLALTGVGRSATTTGGEWVVVGWRPCLDPTAEPEGGVSTRISLYHRTGKAAPKPVASLDLPPVQRFVSPSEDAVVATQWGQLLLIEAATGGSCMGCETLVPLLLTGAKLVMLTPPNPDIALREVTGSSPDIIVTGFLTRFEAYPPLCNACSPSTTIHLRLEKDRLVEACDRFRDNYISDAAAAREELAALAGDPVGPDTVNDLYAGSIARLLDRVNAGETPSGALPDFQDEAAKAIDRADPSRGATIRRSAAALSEAIISAQSTGKLSRACPALGVERPRLR